MKHGIIFIFVILFGCAQSPKKAGSKLTGIWIPEKIDWTSGDFSTLYFLGDSMAVIISSVQKKIGDSILFNVEEGFNLFKGRMEYLSSDNEITIKAKAIYRFIKKTDSAGNEINSDTTIHIVLPTDTMGAIKIGTENYVEATRYTEESKQHISAIVNKMIPSLETKSQGVK